MKQRSLGLNTVLNVIRTILTMLFPVMTFWRISRIFPVETVGSYNFANAAAGYFIMFAALGISTYAVREGVAFRNDYRRISAFSSEIFTINLFSMLAAYLLLGVCILLVPPFRECRSLLLILSVNMAVMTVGCDWVYAVFEDFLYITLRTIAVYALSLVLFFLLVRTPEDLYVYAWITVLATSGAQLLNLFSRKKYCAIRPVAPRRTKAHIRPILTLFANTLTTSLYVNSDMLILGFLRPDYDVGLYSVAVKIYTLFKTLMGAVITAITPRLSALWAAGDRDAFEKSASEIFQAVLTVLLPVAVGLFFLGDQLILILAGRPYLEGLGAVRWLCAALVLSIVGWFITACVLVPAKRDREVLWITAVAAAVNILLNLILIPLIGFTAAAVTTVLAEGIACVLGARKAGRLISLQRMLSPRAVLSVLCGSAVTAGICLLVCSWKLSALGKVLLSFGLSVPVYGLVLLLLKNPSVQGFARLLRREK